MKKYLYTVAALVIFGSTAQAQEVFDLQKCLVIGLEQNYAVQIMRNNEQISDNNVTLANAGYLPTVSLSGGYTGNLNDTRTTARTTGEVAKENGIYNQTANAGLNASWNIFDGFRVQTNYQRLQELQKLGEINTRITIEDFVASLTAEYFNFIQQKIRLKNFNYAVSLSKERLRIVEARYQIGSFSRLDLLQARVDFNADSSKFMNQQELVNASLIRLNELMANPDVNERLIIPDTMIRLDARLEWEQLVIRTIGNNASLLASDRNTALAELDLKTLQSRNYPYLSLGTGYGYTWNRYGSTTTRQRGQLGFNAGVTLGMTLFDGNRRREQNNARIVIQNAHLQRQQLENSLMANLSTFWQAYINYLKIIELEEENQVAARENYEIAMERYLLGDLSGIEMREAQQSLLDAEERILVALYNTKICEISLLQISGQVLHYLYE